MKNNILNIKKASEIFNKTISKAFIYKKSDWSSALAKQVTKFVKSDSVIFDRIVNDFLEYGDLIEDSDLIEDQIKNKEEIKAICKVMVSKIESSSQEDKKEFVNFLNDGTEDKNKFKEMLKDIYKKSETGKSPTYLNAQYNELPDNEKSYEEINNFIMHSNNLKNFFYTFYPFFSKKAVINFNMALDEFKKNKSHVVENWSNNKDVAVAKIMKTACLVRKSVNAKNKDIVRNYIASLKSPPPSLKLIWKNFKNSAPETYRGLNITQILSFTDSLSR